MPIPGLEDIVVIGAGGQHAFAVRRDGTTFAWGNNQDGQLGLGGAPGGDDANVLAPADGWPGLAGLRVTAIDGGRFHSVVLVDDGSVRTFGASIIGQAGQHLRGRSSTPTECRSRRPGYPVPGPSPLATSTRWCYGLAGQGCLGDGTQRGDGGASLLTGPGPVETSQTLRRSPPALAICSSSTRTERLAASGSNFLG